MAQIKTLELSRSQRALADVLAENGKKASALRTTPTQKDGKPIHRTKLWVYSTGRGKPNVDTAGFIERVTDGTVPANGWGTTESIDIDGDSADPANDDEEDDAPPKSERRTNDLNIGKAIEEAR